MNISDHATHRGQQRGIRVSYMEHMMKYGQRSRRPGGAYAYTLNRKGRKRLQRQGLDRQVLDKLSHQVLIVSQEGTVITVYHRD
jgi:hypothetical protein